MKNSAGLLVLAACIQIFAVSVAGDAATAATAASAASGNGDGGVAAGAAAATASGSGNRNGQGTSAAAGAAVAAGGGAGGGSAAAGTAAAAGGGAGGGSAAAGTAAAAGGGAGGGSAAAGAAAAAGGGVGGGSAAAGAAAAAGGSAGGGSAAAGAAAAAGGNGAAAAAAVAVATGTDTQSGYYIPCRCKRIYNPVCATNCKTYANKCVLATIAAYNRRYGLEPIGLHGYGECPRITCNCVKLYDPVCGTDGHTYANKCYLKCEQNRCNPLGLYNRVRVAYKGVCRRSVCHCTDAYIPVCGSDNLTYRNVCILDCVNRYHQSRRRDGIYVKHGGPCTNEFCTCTREYAPICANDGKTYNNQCLLCCENRRRHHLGLKPLIAQNGPCCENCQCLPVYDPVCASNGVTFANRCLLGCENERLQRLKLSALTVCSSGVCPCKCDNYIYDPVCASDDRTYSNECLFNCENQRCCDLGLPPLKIVSKGPCTCNCKGCTLNYEPVCGCDGRTYTNDCWLNCNRQVSNPYRRLYKLCNGPCPCC